VWNLFSREEKNTDWGCLRTWRWEKYFDLREWKLQEAGKSCVILISINCALQHVVIIKMINSMDGVCRMRGEMRNSCRILIGELEGRRPFGRLRRWWVDNIKMDFVEIICESVDWVYLDYDTDSWCNVVNTVKNLPVPQKAEIFLTSWAYC
jgi:hypothetical protein